MLDAFTAILEAKNPAKDCFRSYRLEAGTDLFGTWVVEVTFGRIGARGRTLSYSVSDEAETRRLVRTTFRKRSSAEKRIGVAYAVTEMRDPAGWVPPPAVSLINRVVESPQLCDISVPPQRPTFNSS